MKSDWSVADSADCYGLNRWGKEYFGVNEDGEATVSLRDGEEHVAVSLKKIVDGLKERGMNMPHLLRFRDLLDERVARLNQAFQTAIEAVEYGGEYRGVYPVKVNQQQQVIEEITKFGQRYHYGLEAGSKPELLAALAYMQNPEALIICNGYKDSEFIDLALMARKAGLNVILVVEMPTELGAIIARSQALGIRPEIGIRFRLSTQSAGHWAQSGGDRSVFGLNTMQLMSAVDELREVGYMDTLKLLHYHQGSQLPNVGTIREAAQEAVRVYVNLIKEGAPMGILDMGGGLAVDYDGTHSQHGASCNYGIEEYATNLIEVVMEHCEEAGLDKASHPLLVTESGRAVVAYYSVLAFNILDQASFRRNKPEQAPSEEHHETVHAIWETGRRLEKPLLEAKGSSIGNQLQECLNDAVYYRDQVRELFRYGLVDLRQRALAEETYWYICTQLVEISWTLEEVPEGVEELRKSLTDFYYANLSVFQSLPDAWAIDQVFPIMPLHRLDEEPTNQAILADITCDCDGQIKQFVGNGEVLPYMPVHKLEEGRAYYLGAFLVGAYQETLGDLHNLFGDPHVATVSLEDGEIKYHHEVEGDTVADVLNYVEYEPKQLERKFRSFAESAVRAGRITVEERKALMDAYRHGMAGYTYFED